MVGQPALMPSTSFVGHVATRRRDIARRVLDVMRPPKQPLTVTIKRDQKWPSAYEKRRGLAEERDNLATARTTNLS